MKLAKLGIIWIQDSQIYVADKSLYKTGAEFLEAVIAHIQESVRFGNEEECGWFIVPSFAEYQHKVGKSWMTHRINTEFLWELKGEPGRGHREVWYIDFEKEV